MYKLYTYKDFMGMKKWNIKNNIGMFSSAFLSDSYYWQAWLNTLQKEPFCTIFKCKNIEKKSFAVNN